MTAPTDQHWRARIACISPGGAADPALTELCRKAKYKLINSTSAKGADLGLIDLRAEAITTRCAAAIVETLRKGAPEAAIAFLVRPDTDIREYAALRRFGEVIPAAGDIDHVGQRIREIIRMRNVAEEAGERLKSLAAINRAVEFPVIATDASPPRILIVGAPGPLAINAINAVSDIADTCVCVLTAGQVMRALDYQPFDIAVFLQARDDSAILALTRALRRHRKYKRTTILQIGKTSEDLALSARQGGAAEFMLERHIAPALGRRSALIARRTRLINAMRGFLRACAGEGVRDTASGVFTPTFLGQHGARIAARADQTGRPLNVILTRLVDESKGSREKDRRALRQGARLLGRITRSEDFVARIAPGLFAVTCPATTNVDAKHIALRIEGVLSNTAFQRGHDGAPQSLKIDVAVAAHHEGAAISETIAAALRKLPEERAPNLPQRRSPQ